ncbi:MAG: hypothetical protein A2W31_12585 [Planctomycetes bacterium RBG_16_64_10]|nr:MAG: hypothetical protein A2W31_12585 [Planctomycetes bacterium RBG_16_64_10]
MLTQLFPQLVMIETSSACTGGAAGQTRRPPGPSAPPPIGLWQPTELIGEGTLTRVFRAQPAGRSGLPACYAVKTLRAEWEDDPRAIALIRREAQVGRAVSHPHVVPVLAYRAHERPYFVTMPLLAGATLAAQTASGRRLAVPIALWIARQVAEGLDGLYHTGWMHGDVKPSNIFLAPDGHVTLIDLGYACAIDQRATVGDRPVVGTINYMAPEVLTSTLATDIRSDIYSLGITLYEMLGGAAPFHASDPRRVAVLQRQAVAPRLDVADPQMPSAVADLVQGMLAKEPLRRPQTPRELADLLTRLEIKFFAQRADRQSQVGPLTGWDRPAGLSLASGR